MRLNPEANPVGHRPKATRIWSVRRRTTVLACLVGTLVAAGCGSSGAKSAPGGSNPTRPASTIVHSTTTIDQLAADKAEITATFNGWGELVGQFEAETKKWDESQATRFIGGPALVDARDWIPKWQAAGKRAVRSKNSKAHSAVQQIDVTGDRASLRTCEVNDLVTEAADGSVLDDSVKTHFAIWTVRRQPKGWKIWSVTKSWSEDGVSKCGS